MLPPVTFALRIVESVVASVSEDGGEGVEEGEVEGEFRF
jgi:hypothetical protein